MRRARSHPSVFDISPNFVDVNDLDVESIASCFFLSFFFFFCDQSVSSLVFHRSSNHFKTLREDEIGFRPSDLMELMSGPRKCFTVFNYPNFMGYYIFLIVSTELDVHEQEKRKEG